MVLTDYSKRLLNLSQTVHKWLGVLTTLDRGRRLRIARYATAIADTLARAAAALARLHAEPGSKSATRDLKRELGRISGYVETIVSVLEHHLDGRKLAGVKRRLETLETGLSALRPPGHALDAQITGRRKKVKKSRKSRTSMRRESLGRIEQLLAAEGYFRAMADGQRT